MYIYMCVCVCVYQGGNVGRDASLAGATVTGQVSTRTPDDTGIFVAKEATPGPHILSDNQRHMAYASCLCGHREDLNA